MRENVFFRYGFPLLIALPIGFLLLYPQLFRCMRIGTSADFWRMAGSEEVYISRTATAKQQAQLRQNSQIARNRIRRFWGDQYGNATLIIARNKLIMNNIV